MIRTGPVDAMQKTASLAAISSEGTSHIPHVSGTERQTELWLTVATVAKETYSICSLAGSLQATASLSSTVCQGSCPV